MPRHALQCISQARHATHAPTPTPRVIRSTAKLECTHRILTADRGRLAQTFPSAFMEFIRYVNLIKHSRWVFPQKETRCVGDHNWVTDFAKGILSVGASQGAIYTFGKVTHPIIFPTGATCSSHKITRFVVKSFSWQRSSGLACWSKLSASCPYVGHCTIRINCRKSLAEYSITCLNLSMMNAY